MVFSANWIAGLLQRNRTGSGGNLVMDGRPGIILKHNNGPRVIRFRNIWALMIMIRREVVVGNSVDLHVQNVLLYQSMSFWSGVVTVGLRLSGGVMATSGFESRVIGFLASRFMPLLNLMIGHSILFLVKLHYARHCGEVDTAINSDLWILM